MLKIKVFNKKQCSFYKKYALNKSVEYYIKKITIKLQMTAVFAVQPRKEKSRTYDVYSPFSKLDYEDKIETPLTNLRQLH